MSPSMTIKDNKELFERGTPRVHVYRLMKNNSINLSSSNSLSKKKNVYFYTFQMTFIFMRNIALTQNKCILCEHMIYNINVGCVSKVEGLNQLTENFLLHNQCIYDVSLPKKRSPLTPTPTFLFFNTYSTSPSLYPEI